MPEYPPLAAFDFERVCNCRRISRGNLLNAMNESAGIATGNALYTAALLHRREDIEHGQGGPVTGLEFKGDGYNCTRRDGREGGNCAHLFEEAAQHLNQKRTIAIVSPAGPDASAPRIGECGKDCNTCASAKTTDCAPGLSPIVR